MADNTYIHWNLANRFGIWVDGPDSWVMGHPDHPSEPWHGGRANDVLTLSDGSLIAASDAGGVWRIGAAGVSALPVSNNWNFSRFRCLAFGPNANDGTHIYAGGTALFETDLSDALPLIAWREITSLSTQFPRVGMIYRIAVLEASRIIALATNLGVLWSFIPAAPQRPGCLDGLFGGGKKPSAAGDGYQWRQAKTPGIPDGGAYSIAAGPVIRQEGRGDRVPFESLMVSGLDGGVKDFDSFTGPRGLFFGVWEDRNTLVLRPAAVSLNGSDVSLIQASFGLVSLASFDPDRSRAYAVASFAPSDDSFLDKILGVLRTDDGGRNWEILDEPRVEDLDSHYPIRDSGQIQTNYTTCIAVSPNDPDILMMGFTTPLLSFNAGQTWWLPGSTRPKPGPGSDPRASTYNAHLHADLHGLRFFKGPEVLDGGHFTRDTRLAHAATDGGLVEIEWGYGAWMTSIDYYGNDNNPDFLAVVLEGNDLNVYLRESDKMDKGWRNISTITHRATGPGCIIQSDFHSVEDHGNFEVVALEGSDLVHYWGYLDNGKIQWNIGGVITSSASGPACLIQSSYRDSDHGHFEVVVLEGTELVHYSKNNDDVNNPWGKAGVVTTHAVGPGCIIQSDFPFDQDDPNFEVVVLEDRGLVHYWRDNSGSPWPWKGGWLITANATGPGCIFQSDYRASNDDHGNFELVVPEGRELVEWYKDNSGGKGWVRLGPITAPGHCASGPGRVLQSNYGSGSSGNFELLACDDGEIVHYWRDNANPQMPWRRGSIVSRKAHTFRSEFNRFLTTLENEKQAAATLNSVGYGTTGVCAAVSGLVAGGLQDNGVAYGVSGQSGTPWLRVMGGDGFGTAFLPGRTPRGRILSTGTTLITYNNEEESKETGGPVRAYYWMAGKMNPHLLQGVKGKENIIPLGKLNPSQSPAPDPQEGLGSPRMEPVLEPRFDQKGLLCALGATNGDVYGLFVENVEGYFVLEGEIKLPMRWDYLGSIPTWDSKISSIVITALAAFDGSLVFSAADATFQDGHVEQRIYSLDASTGTMTQMLMSPAIFSSTVNGMVALGNHDVYAVTAGGAVIHWAAKTVTGGFIWEMLNAGTWSPPLTAITADPTTQPPTLFVGSVQEVHTSLDRGTTWQRAMGGLPRTFQVSDLRWVDDGSGQHVFVSTYGRSTWVADKVERRWG